MIKIKNGKLSKKEQAIINQTLRLIPDFYGEFYDTKSNLRLYLSDNPDVLFQGITKGNYLIYDTEEKGMLLITGYADKFHRKYVKILADNNAIIYKLLLMTVLHIKEELFIKVNKHNPVIKILREFGFVFQAGRGKQILMKREK